MIKIEVNLFPEGKKMHYQELGAMDKLTSWTFHHFKLKYKNT